MSPIREWLTLAGGFLALCGAFFVLFQLPERTWEVGVGALMLVSIGGFTWFARKHMRGPKR
jgi:hypothetical protein